MSNEIKAAIVTASDTRTPSDDASGDCLEKLLRDFGIEVVERSLVTDDMEALRDTLLGLTERDDVNLVLTTGGTGLGPRDNTPEATLAVIEREAPGISEAIRRESYSKTPMAMLSRGVAGIRNRTLVVNFPGSPKAVTECFEVLRPILKHAIDLIAGNTNH